MVLVWTFVHLAHVFRFFGVCLYVSVSMCLSVFVISINLDTNVKLAVLFPSSSISVSSCSLCNFPLFSKYLLLFSVDLFFLNNQFKK